MHYTEYTLIFTFNPFYATGLFLYPLKTSKNPGFVMFSGGIERNKRHEMGSCEFMRRLIYLSMHISRNEA